MLQNVFGRGLFKKPLNTNTLNTLHHSSLRFNQTHLVFTPVAIISMPLRAAGNSRWKSFWVGALSGIVEPIGGALVILLAAAVMPMMPYLLAFAAGAMLYVVVEELVPEASQGEHSNIATVGFALGFALMMVLDVVMG